MRNIIHEKRKVTFGNIRITPDIIRRLASIVDTEVRQEIDTNKNNCFYLYSVEADDDSSYESQSMSIFSEYELIETKVIQKVSMRFNLIDNSKNIEIQIVHVQDDENKENYILVSGDDSNWVNGVISRIREVLDLSEAQPKYNVAIGWGVLIFAVLFLALYIRIVNPELKKWNDDISSLAFIIVFLLSTFGGMSLAKYLQSMFPAVELQTGANYLQIPMKKRRKINLIMMTVVIPLLLALVYDIVKSIMKI